MYACVACGVVLCGRGPGSHMGEHVASVHGRGQGGTEATATEAVCVYFGIPQGFNGKELRGGKGGETAGHAWCYACEAACSLEYDL